ncbi:hypothetical protein TNCV_3075391 [Trichonephila clavipes]|nr:hypothetical protein TNCV_3075391 [Trichonephila clavipes]
MWEDSNRAPSDSNEGTLSITPRRSSSRDVYTGLLRYRYKGNTTTLNVSLTERLFDIVMMLYCVVVVGYPPEIDEDRQDQLDC